MNTDSIRIGERLLLPDVGEIARIRKSLGITQLELSKLTEINRSSISKLERGDIDLSYSKVKRIFEELETQRVRHSKNNVLENAQLKEIHSTPYSSVRASERLIDVYAKIVETDYSQFVVVQEGTIVGSISERRVNRAIIENGADAQEHQIGQYMEDPFPVLSINTLVSTVLPLLQSYQAVLTREENEIVGIVTNNDIGKIFKK